MLHTPLLIIDLKEVIEMINGIKIEYQKMKLSSGIKIAVVIGLILALGDFWYFYKTFYHMFLNEVEESVNGGKYAELIYPPTAIRAWMGSDFTSVFVQLLYLLMPVIAVIPFGASLYVENKSGYVKNVYTKTNKRNYLCGKYIVAFISGGFVSALPLIFNYMIWLLFLPNMPEDVRSMQSVVTNKALFATVYSSNPTLYVMLYALLAFVFGGLFATVSVGISKLANNVFMVYLFPFLVNMCAYYLIINTKSLGYVPMSFLNPLFPNTTSLAMIFTTGGIIFVSSVLLAIFNYLGDTLE